MTSNAGSHVIETATDEAEMQEKIMRELKNHFRPEFLNRIDDIVVYTPLSEKILASIVQVLLRDVTTMLAHKHITVVYHDTLIQELIRTGYDPEF